MRVERCGAGIGGGMGGIEVDGEDGDCVLGTKGVVIDEDGSEKGVGTGSEDVDSLVGGGGTASEESPDAEVVLGSGGGGRRWYWSKGRATRVDGRMAAGASEADEAVGTENPNDAGSGEADAGGICGCGGGGD